LRSLKRSWNEFQGDNDASDLTGGQILKRKRNHADEEDGTQVVGSEGHLLGTYQTNYIKSSR